jgi:predicted double-glycine peptidase
MRKIVICITLLIFTCLGASAITKKQAIDFFKLNHNHQITFLNIKDFQQTEDYTCGSAVVMSLLHYYGKLPAQEMNKKTEMRIAKEMGTTSACGTSDQQIVNWLNKHGFEAKTFHNGSVAILRQNLAKGIPTLVDWIDWGGHWVVVTGYDYAGNPKDMSGDTIFFSDPASHFDNVKTLGGITFINPERFESMWMNMHSQHNIYITAVPINKKH